MNKENLKLEYRDPKTLAPNPRNWRKHPEQQKKLLNAMIKEVGYAGALLWNEQTGKLIDGHARRDLAIANKEKLVPVLVGSWTEAEEKKILATLDPIAAMAEQADELYRELLGGMETESEDLKAWCDNMMMSLSTDMEPDKLDPPLIVGDDTRTGRFILVFESQKEKEAIMNRIGIDGKKVVYTFGELQNG
jgi:hypothetical protein